MVFARSWWVLVASAVAESAWLYAAAAVLGLIMHGGGSPLGWAAVLAVIGSAAVVTRLLQHVVAPHGLSYAAEMAVGVLVVYLAVGSQVTGGGGLDLGWLSRLAAPPPIDGYRFRAAMGSLIAVGLWWRGGRLASAEEPFETLLTSFRIGLFAIGVAAILDSANSADLGIYPIMFVFVGSGLAGLGISRLLPASANALRTGAWPKVIASVVAAVVMGGLLIGLAQERLLSWVPGVVSVPLFFLLDHAVLPVVVLIARVVHLVIAWLVSLLAQPGAQGDSPPAPPAIEGLEELREAAADRDVPIFIEAIGWFLLALLIVAALVLLARAFRRRDRGRWVYAEGLRESVTGEADPAHDLARLLFGLLPGRFRKRRRQWRAYKLPEGDTGVVEALRIYYRLLNLAELRGVARSPSETAAEFEGKLEALFPSGLVRMATAAFNRACYGGHPAPEAHLGEMRALVDRLASAPA